MKSPSILTKLSSNLYLQEHKAHDMTEKCETCGKFVSREDGYYLPPLYQGESVRLVYSALCDPEGKNDEE